MEKIIGISYIFNPIMGFYCPSLSQNKGTVLIGVKAKWEKRIKRKGPFPGCTEGKAGFSSRPILSYKIQPIVLQLKNLNVMSHTIQLSIKALGFLRLHRVSLQWKRKKLGRYIFCSFPVSKCLYVRMWSTPLSKPTRTYGRPLLLQLWKPTLSTLLTHPQESPHLSPLWTWMVRNQCCVYTTSRWGRSLDSTDSWDEREDERGAGQ